MWTRVQQGGRPSDVQRLSTTDVTSVAALGEPIRRDLYRYVVSEEVPPGREEAAACAGESRTTWSSSIWTDSSRTGCSRWSTAGHLGAAGRVPVAQQGGTGARRERISVSLPDTRGYDLAGHVMAEAITIADPRLRPGHRGAAIGGQGRGARGSSPMRRRRRTPSAGEILADNGYEPRTTGADGIALANCPFHSLAQKYTELVCGLNLDLIDGVLDALGASELCARLDPAPGRCCVTIA